MTDFTKIDRFLRIDTWHTGHPNDLKRFYTILKELLEDPNFNPDQMGEHMRNKLGIDRNDEEHGFNKAIDDLTAGAWAVREYLDATQGS